jgi:hypothetical protein
MPMNYTHNLRDEFSNRAGQARFISVYIKVGWSMVIDWPNHDLA